MPDTSTPPSPLADCTLYSPPLSGTTPVPRQKRFSMESHTTLVADDDDDDNPWDAKQSFGNKIEDGDLLHGTKLATLRIDNFLVDRHWMTTMNPDLPLPAASTTTTTVTTTAYNPLPHWKHAPAVYQPTAQASRYGAHPQPAPTTAPCSSSCCPRTFLHWPP